MADLKDLFKERDDLFTDKTLEIFSQITGTLDAVTIFFNEIDEAVSQGIMSWEDVNIMEDLIILIGVVQYNLGDTVTIGDLDIVVTEENKEDLQRIMHMSVPLELVEENDAEKILEFLHEMNVDKDSEDFTTLIEIPVQHPGNTPEQDFDLTDLDEQQIQSLKYFSDNKGKN